MGEEDEEEREEEQTVKQKKAKSRPKVCKCTCHGSWVQEEEVIRTRYSEPRGDLIHPKKSWISMWEVEGGKGKSEKWEQKRNMKS